MGDKLSDADLVSTLRAVEGSTSAIEAARRLGISTRAVRERLSEARLRNLSVHSSTDELGQLRAKVKQLQAALAEARTEELTAESIRQQVYKLAASPACPPAWISKPSAAGLAGVPMTMWSDWHYGEVISRDEVGGVNTFNPAEARKRVDRLLERTFALAFDHMTGAKYPGIVVALGGDFISGDIHDELAQTNSGTTFQAVEEVRDILLMALRAVADKFGRVFVPCVVGNHGRNTRKPQAKRRVYTSFEWNLYNQLELFFRNDKRLQFAIPPETDVFFACGGHRFLLTHGDALGVKGGDGIIGAIGPIARGTFKVGRSEAQVGRDFDTLLMGHWHTYIPRGDAVPVIVNGSLKGYDEYARLGLRVPYSRPSQSLWFVHEKVGITAQWQIYLDAARRGAGTANWVEWAK